MEDINKNIQPLEAVNICIKENKLLKSSLKKFRKVIHKCKRDSVALEFPEVFNELKSLEEQFDLQEKVLFPLLLKEPQTPAVTTLYEQHDEIRATFKSVLSAYERGHTAELCSYSKQLVHEIHEIITIEEKIIFPSIPGLSEKG
ncbi:MAG: hemerythrin domain-containing protein [Spirochaetales bacterium]|nr:hemerythrin domain-containing protein [Spirochaetales bacterium]